MPIEPGFAVAAFPVPIDPGWMVALPVPIEPIPAATEPFDLYADDGAVGRGVLAAEDMVGAHNIAAKVRTSVGISTMWLLCFMVEVSYSCGLEGSCLQPCRLRVL